MENYYLKNRKTRVLDFFEKKGALDYLPWAKAWDLLKAEFPEANFKILKDPETRYNYFTNNLSGWVTVEVTVNNITHGIDLAIMDNKNKSIPKDNITSVDAQNSIMRALTKAIALHGLGLNAWTNEKDFISDSDYAKVMNEGDRHEAQKVFKNCDLTDQQKKLLINKFKNQNNVKK